MKTWLLLGLCWVGVSLAQPAPSQDPVDSLSEPVTAEAPADEGEELVDEAVETRKPLPIHQLGQSVDDNLLSLQGSLNGGAGTLDILRDKKLRAQLAQAFANNPMTKMPRDVLRPMVLQQLAGTPWAKVIERFPKTLDFFVDFMRHPSALSQLIKVLDRPKALRNCGIASLVMMVLLMVVRRRLAGPDSSFLGRLALQLMTSSFFLVFSFALFWVVFRDEFGPTWDVFRATFLA